MQNVAMNRFCWGSWTLLNNPHCHSFDFSSAALLHSTSNLSSKNSSNMWPESKNRPQTPSWPVTTGQCRCALPQVRSCAHLGRSMWLWCKHNKHMMQANPMTHSWFLTIREQPIIYKRRLLTRSWSRGTAQSCFSKFSNRILQQTVLDEISQPNWLCASTKTTAVRKG